jgi:hypothetical protein
MRVIAGVIAAAVVASCAVVPDGQARLEERKPTTSQTEATLGLRLLRVMREAYDAQVRLDVEAMLQGMAAADGTRLAAAVPELRSVLPE